MTRFTFTAFDPRTEINGRTVTALITNINHEQITDILKRHGFDNLDLEAWYPVQSVLNVLSDVAEGNNSSSNLVAIGMAASQRAIEVFPTVMNTWTLEQFFTEYGKIYQQRHRGGDIGYVQTEVIDDHHLVLRTKMPYPDDVGYGIFYAYARHFCPKDKRFTVHYDEQITRRDHGGEETRYHVYLR